MRRVDWWEWGGGNTHVAQTQVRAPFVLFIPWFSDAIRRLCGASLAKDVVLFAGNGATGAINLAVEVTGLNWLPNRDCVVIVSIHEHHSNILIWRELGWNGMRRVMRSCDCCESGVSTPPPFFADQSVHFLIFP